MLRREQVAPNTFRRLVNQHELLQPDHEVENKPRLAFAKAHANEMWQADTMYGPYVLDRGTKVQTRLIAFIDDASRVCCHGQFFLREKVDITNGHVAFVDSPWSLTALTQDHLRIPATGRLTTYPGGSRYQMVIEALEPAGIGALMAQLEKRRQALAAEGLFDAARKQPIPYLPRVIGVVTSPTGAVIRDILHRLADRFPRKYVMILIYAIVASAIPLLFLADQPWALYAFAVVFGIGLGGDYMIIPLMAGDLFGVGVLGRVMGIVLTADGVAEATVVGRPDPRWGGVGQERQLDDRGQLARLEDILEARLEERHASILVYRFADFGIDFDADDVGRVGLAVAGRHLDLGGAGDHGELVRRSDHLAARCLRPGRRGQRRRITEQPELAHRGNTGRDRLALHRLSRLLERGRILRGHPRR